MLEQGHRRPTIRRRSPAAPRIRTSCRTVDQDGNEVAGIRLPPVEAPIATTTGWALRRADFGENEGCEANGQHIPFKTTKRSGWPPAIRVSHSRSATALTTDTWRP